MKIRNKKTIIGRMLEVDYYPIFDDGRRVPTRAPKTKLSTEAQAKYNRAKAKKKIVRLVNANFDNTDINSSFLATINLHIVISFVIHLLYNVEC